MQEGATMFRYFLSTGSLEKNAPLFLKDTIAENEACPEKSLDVYPHGGVIPGRTYQNTLGLPYAYQGIEKDPETNLLNFELRQYDARLGRWFNPDPYGQFHSPYLAMGNNPISSVDPDGGWSYDQFFNSSSAPNFGGMDSYNFATDNSTDGNTSQSMGHPDADIAAANSKWMSDYMQSGSYHVGKLKFEKAMANYQYDFLTNSYGYYSSYYASKIDDINDKKTEVFHSVVSNQYSSSPTVYINFGSQVTTKYMKGNIINEVTNIFSKNGISLNIVETSLSQNDLNLKNYDHYVQFDKGDAYTSPGHGETYSGQSTIYYRAIWQQFNAVVSGNTRLVSNVVAHEISHGYMEKANLLFYGQEKYYGGISTGEDIGHYNSPINLLTTGGKRLSGVSGFDSDWETGKYSNLERLLPYQKSLIRNYIFQATQKTQIKKN